MTQPQMIKSSKVKFKERKKERSEYYEQNVKGVRLNDCLECNGTGLYKSGTETTSAQGCAKCNGFGKQWYTPEYYEVDELMRSHIYAELSENVRINAFILNRKTIVYQYIGLDDSTKDPKRYAKLKYGYDEIEDRFGWYFTNQFGGIFFLHQFELSTFFTVHANNPGQVFERLQEILGAK